MTHKGDFFKKHLPPKQVCHGGVEQNRELKIILYEHF
tara:strand:- start:369 stop:479 length:111 start_codon:yes stop_codon:yes gene_type:complete